MFSLSLPLSWRRFVGGLSWASDIANLHGVCKRVMSQYGATWCSKKSRFIVVVIAEYVFLVRKVFIVVARNSWMRVIRASGLVKPGTTSSVGAILCSFIRLGVGAGPIPI